MKVISQCQNNLFNVVVDIGVYKFILSNNLNDIIVEVVNCFLFQDWLCEFGINVLILSSEEVNVLVQQVCGM